MRLLPLKTYAFVFAVSALGGCSDSLDSGEDDSGEDLVGSGGFVAGTGGGFPAGSGGLGTSTGGLGASSGGAPGLATGGGLATATGGDAGLATGGNTASGGDSSSATGGVSATGGDSGSATGGSSATGGDSGSSTGGNLATGGDSGSSTGGSVPTGGSVATGGTSATGGDSGSSSGGSGGAECTNIRPTGTDWDEGTCDGWATYTEECGEAWMVDNNYCNQSCGRCDSTNTGGSTSTGGASGTGGAGTGGSDPNWTSVETVCANKIGSQGGFTYEYWKDQGTGCMELGPNGAFSVEWNNINNLLARKSIRPGSANNVVTYAADYQPNGNSYLTVYGWSRNPLVEYYIVDSWGTWRPPGNEGHMGTVTTDGGTYDIYRTQRVNQPSIDGNATFYQYWSVRTTKRSSGTITVKNHFNAWATHGMNMGTLYEVSMCVEGYQSSGTANVYSLSIK